MISPVILPYLLMASGLVIWGNLALHVKIRSQYRAIQKCPFENFTLRVTYEMSSVYLGNDVKALSRDSSRSMWGVSRNLA
jgi:hypothetical protein